MYHRKTTTAYLFLILCCVSFFFALAGIAFYAVALAVRRKKSGIPAVILMINADSVELEIIFTVQHLVLFRT